MLFDLVIIGFGVIGVETLYGIKKVLLKKLTKNKNIVRVTPLPPVEIKKGPIVICPPNKAVKNFFKHLGEVIEIKNEKIKLQILGYSIYYGCLL